MVECCKNPGVLPAQVLLALEDVYADPPRMSMHRFTEMYILEEGESLDTYMETILLERREILPRT